VTRSFVYPAKPRPGDRVAILSPSGRSAAQFPDRLDLGLERLRERFGLEPVEFPTTRAAQASPAERAADTHAAFSDPSIRAVIATIGGEDQITVLRHLDPHVLRSNPKPFFGFSDNTNLLLYLWNLGIVSYHGGALMLAFARATGMHPLTEDSIRAAMFGSGPYELTVPQEFSDEDVPWTHPRTLLDLPRQDAAIRWEWQGPARAVTGRAWGGSLEMVDMHLRTNRYLLEPSAYEGCILFLETSEEMPDAEHVYRVLMSMGERELLQRFAALVWARPKAWSIDRRNDAAGKASFTADQRAAVIRAAGEYIPDVPLVFGVDFGHTDPQLVIPIGGDVTVDALERRITVRY
jgi:muramoyltetrapeptide carboxypeptidase LdcA involved in peptidoglycan recycling